VAQRRAGLAFLYAVVLAASPALHHDLDCHLKSPTHCTACLANAPAPGAAQVGTPRIALLQDPMRLELPEETWAEAILVGRLKGRSPPL